MGNAKTNKVMVKGTTLWFLLALPCLVSSIRCPQGKQFLDAEKQRCTNCTVCDHRHGFVVLRPCEVHRDTICGTINDLTMEWKSFPNVAEKKPVNTKRNHHRHHHGQKLVWNFDDDQKTNDLDVIDDKTFTETFVTSTETSYSSAETLVWDWQAIALTVAIFSCILFFLVIALYSLHQAKQWRRLKENFEADVEELSVKLSLMSASPSEKGDPLDQTLGSIRDGNYMKSRCVYLEQLLNVRKDTKVISDKKGNVYIEEANTNNGKT